jgi:hypothetical protein
MSFLLDIVEVPESHSGATLGNAFQKEHARMLWIGKQGQLINTTFFHH